MTDVKTEIRTSSHTWCQDPRCLDDPLVKAVTARVVDVSATPEGNAEFAQLEEAYGVSGLEGDVEEEGDKHAAPSATTSAAPRSRL